MLAEYVALAPNDKEVAVDDAFTLLPNSQTILDVLANDGFSDTQGTTITNVSNPSQGTVTLNDDNTLTYVAPNIPQPMTDTFIYIAQNQGSNTQPNPATATVTITVTNHGENFLYTNEAKAVLQQRFENGFVFGPGFNDDIAQVRSFATSFMQDPGEHRPIFGEKDMSQSFNGKINREGHNLHTTAVYAYAVDDVKMANAVASEILAIVNTNDLYTGYWNNSHTLRWDNQPENHWIMASKALKMKDSYNFVKKLETVLTETDKTNIADWFARFAHLCHEGLKQRLDNAYFGTGWDADHFPDPYYRGRLSGYAPPVQDAQGNDLFQVTIAQDVYNNRFWDIVGYVHSWAVENNDVERETYTRNFFKVWLKYGVFPDGTVWEMSRATESTPFAGIAYSWISTEAAVRMAHTDAMANHFPNDRLYDYRTADGVLNGSTTISDTPYEGTSTTDGTTEKSLLKVIKALSKYLRSTADGGWNDVRFFNGTALNSVGTSQPSAIPAMANLYYKDQDLVDLYTYNQDVGYPAKQSFGGGYMSGVWDKDSGGWGNLIFGSMWYDLENQFFN
ncbi:Ig-like domain-containing protein [Maribacter sp. 2307ULW6-5]|uniref:Ig-like domain-containing protein n=1 Tax=Maribacter sp. 2307ULW6-5 TaxID=3386275 RepID=UPI0039BD7E46